MNTSKSDSRLLLGVAALIAVTGLLVKFAGVAPSHDSDIGEMQSNAALQTTAQALPLKFTGRYAAEGSHALESKRLLDIQLAALTRFAQGKQGTVAITETRYQRTRSPSPQTAPALRIEQAVQVALPAGSHAEIEGQLRLLGLHEVSLASRGQ